MLPLHAHGYRRGLSASPGFRHIRQTSSSSSSSSSYFAGGGAVDAVGSISFPLEPRGDEAEEEEGVSVARGLPSREGGGS